MIELTETEKSVAKAFGANKATIEMWKLIKGLPKETQEKIDKDFRNGIKKGAELRRKTDERRREIKRKIEA